jgi:hypothetical protein
MNPVTRIAPISDPEAARLASPDTLTALAGQITSTPAAGAPGRAGRRAVAGRRLVIGVPVAAAAAVAGLVVSSLGGPGGGPATHPGARPGARVGTAIAGHGNIQATVLSVTRHDGYLDVIVKNPTADARKHRAEFARLGLNITLTLVPASPSLVGTLVYFQSPSSIKPITAVGKCWTGGGGNVCPVGVQVPLGFKGAAVLTFGRPARPGEQYETTGPVTAKGEAMHGMTFVGKRAAAVVAMLAARHVTVANYRFQNAKCEGTSRKSMPARWYVTGANPWAPGQVTLNVSKVWPARVCAGAGSPVPAPKPTSSTGSH